MSIATSLPKPNQTASVSDFSRGGATEAFRRAQESPVFVLNRNKPTAVILGFDKYVALQHYMEHLEDMEDARTAEQRLEKTDGSLLTEEALLKELDLTQNDIETAPEVEFE